MESRLSDIAQGAFALEDDRKICQVMRKLKVFDWLVKEISRRRYEKYSRLAYTAGAVRCGEKAYPTLAQMLADVCSAFDLKTPQLFVCHDNAAAARLIGEVEPMLLVSTGMLELLTEAEMKCVLAQQVSHMHCNHEAFLIARDLLNSAADNMGILKGVVAPVRMMLERWYAMAQMSCDRGALLYTDDFASINSLLTKLAGGGVGMYGGVDPQVLLTQYGCYDSAKEDTPVCPLFQTWSSLYVGISSHVVRTHKLKEWVDSGAYADFRSGNYPSEKDITEQEAKAYWGAYAGADMPWESVDIDEQLLFGIGGMDEELKKLGSSAETVIRAGAEAAGKAAETLASTLFKVAGSIRK